MMKLIPSAIQLVFIVLLSLFVLIPYAGSYKILSKRLLSDLGSGNPISQLTDAADVLGSIFFDIKGPLLTHGEQVRPGPGYHFEPPNTTANPPDQRGPCPGLNLLANYGYLPRNGIVTAKQVLKATGEGFNMGIDIAAVLTALAVVSSGNITTQKFSLGGPDRRVHIGDVGGLTRHACVENDISPNREDYYLGNCDDHHLSSRLFKQNVQFAKNRGGLFNFAAMTDQFSQNAKYSQKNNPYLFYTILSSALTKGAHIFYPYLFSNGTYDLLLPDELNGKPDYTSISYIVGANLIKNGTDHYFEYIPERWPEINNTAGKPWYRRGIPFTFIQLLPLINLMLTADPTVPPFGTSGNYTLQSLGCAIYLQIIQITPIVLAQTEQNVADAITFIISLLDPIFSNTTFGCPAHSFSNNDGSYPAYPYANRTGSVNDPVPATCSEKTNQYGRVYFPTPPK